MNLRRNDSQRNRTLAPRSSQVATIHAPAKINLFLDVLGRTGDGYHELATLMLPIRWFDSLTFEPLPAENDRPGPFEFAMCGVGLDGNVPEDSRNLVIRALQLLRERNGCDAGARVELVKRIPSGAGLGGGSSDAAAALQLANRGWNLNWPAERLATLAAELGSDVPFFLASGAAICRGRGERIERLPPGRPLDLVIVKPPASLSTADVYRRFDELPVEEGRPRNQVALASLVNDLRQGAVRRMAAWMSNGLQAAAASLSSWIGRLAAAFAELGFAAHQLTGSGAAYFGVCRHAGEARRLAMTLHSRQLGRVFVTRSCG
ncbi:MAG: 4-(cytidine 5'-diphospho)-2-C-methyl-D-erythritol kinase [Pirellulales bacterium]